MRRWGRKFGQHYASTLRRRRVRPGDTWRLDEVSVGIDGAQHDRWRAVDRDGTVLDILAQRRRGRADVPRVVSTDTLASYGAAKREALPSVEHRQHKRRNNRAENARQPTRGRERRMRRFEGPGHAQRCLSAHGPIAPHVRPRRRRLTAACREIRAQRFAAWRAATDTPATA